MAIVPNPRSCLSNTKTFISDFSISTHHDWCGLYENYPPNFIWIKPTDRKRKDLWHEILFIITASPNSIIISFVILMSSVLSWVQNMCGKNDVILVIQWLNIKASEKSLFIWISFQIWYVAVYEEIFFFSIIYSLSSLFFFSCIYHTFFWKF